jgi:hypothetical protein
VTDFNQKAFHFTSPYVAEENEPEPGPTNAAALCKYILQMRQERLSFSRSRCVCVCPVPSVARAQTRHHTARRLGCSYLIAIQTIIIALLFPLPPLHPLNLLLPTRLLLSRSSHDIPAFPRFPQRWHPHLLLAHHATYLLPLLCGQEAGEAALAPFDLGLGGCEGLGGRSGCPADLRSCLLIGGLGICGGRWWEARCLGDGGDWCVVFVGGTAAEGGS